MPKPLDQAQAGAAYRDARDAISVHLGRQAAAELAYRHLARRHGADHAETAVARDLVEKAVADVAWCRACTVAAAEAYKGVTLAEAIAAQGPRPTVDDLARRAGQEG